MRNSIVGSVVTLSWKLGAFAIAASIAGQREAHAQGAPGTPTPRIVVSGTGEAHVAPDRATIFVGVQSRATTASAAGADNARRQRAILDTLKALGLTPDQLSTINYNVSPEMNYNQPNGGTPKVTGYVVTNTVRADVRRIADIGRLVDAALSKGANEISSLQFYSSKADSARRAAMADAVKNAQADAEALARASGGSLGGVIEISTASAPVRPFAEMAMAKVAGAPTPIEPGQQTISTTVTVTYRLIER